MIWKVCTRDTGNKLLRIVMVQCILGQFLACHFLGKWVKPDAKGVTCMNEGFDETGEHCGKSSVYCARAANEQVTKFPLALEENKIVRENLRLKYGLGKQTVLCHGLKDIARKIQSK